MTTRQTGLTAASRIGWRCHLGIAAAACMALAYTGVSHADGDTVHESVEISDMYLFNTDVKANGAVILVRDFDKGMVTINLQTGALQPGWAYSIWIAVFNFPEYCSDPCGIDDLPGANPNADPKVKPSVFYGGGLLADGSGYGSASTEISVGKTSRELFAATENYGLQQLRKAHIHVVLRSHGEALVGGIAKQIGTASSTCNTAEGCQNVLASFHPPIE